VIDTASVPITQVSWIRARRIIRSRFPPIDLFEDIADPEDWPLLIAAEQKTNPRLMETLGSLDLVPPARRVSGPGATYLMAPFTHISVDRPSRFSDGSYGVLYVARAFKTALLETVHHHARFMASTREAPGWEQFRELVLDIEVGLYDLRSGAFDPALDRDSYTESQALGRQLRAAGTEGLVYPSQRDPGGECAALFYPDRASNPVQGRHLDYHWNGADIDLVRDAGSRDVYRIRDDAVVRG
jgi:hypothetical protein